LYITSKYHGRNSNELINNKTLQHIPTLGNLGREESQNRFSPQLGKNAQKIAPFSPVIAASNKLIREKSPIPPARGLIYKILAFIRTKNVETIKKTSKTGTVQPTCLN
jgi:hypothetical protein